MAEVLGLASSIITVVGVAGKLGTSTIRLKRLWDEVQDIPASIQRCIEHLELLVPAIEEMGDEFQRTRLMVQNDSAAKRSLEYSRKAVATLESLVRDMETQLTTAKKGRRLVAQLKVRMKKEVIEEHQQQLQSVLQLVGLSQQTYLIALSRAQPQIIISEIKNWQNSNQLVSENAKEDGVSTNHEQTTGNLAPATYSYPGSRNWWASKDSIPWRNAGLFGRISYFSQGSVDNIYASQLRVQPPNWLASKAWDLQICRALAGWDIQMRTWTTRPHDSDIFNWVRAGSTNQVVQAIMNKEASLYDRTPQGFSLSGMALMSNRLELLGRLISLGVSLDDIDVTEAIFSLLPASVSMHVMGSHVLNLIWIDHKEEILEHWVSAHSTASKDARMASFCEWIGKHDTEKFIGVIQTIEWDTANPEKALEIISRGAIGAHEIRKRKTFDFRLQDLAIEYLHEYLNCSPRMEEWRLITQTLFRNATWEELAALNIDKIVKDIWNWQFPLGPFEKWLKRGLGMLKEDLAKAGVDFKELASLHGISRDQEQSELTTIESMEWVRILTGERPWDPFVEGLAGEFWFMIETTQLPIPGSWVSDDEDDNFLFRCLFQSGDGGSSCFERRQDLYQREESRGNNPLKVRGMMSCRERYHGLTERKFNVLAQCIYLHDY